MSRNIYSFNAHYMFGFIKLLRLSSSKWKCFVSFLSFVTTILLAFMSSMHAFLRCFVWLLFCLFSEIKSCLRRKRRTTFIYPSMLMIPCKGSSTKISVQQFALSYSISNFSTGYSAIMVNRVRTLQSYNNNTLDDDDDVSTDFHYWAHNENGKMTKNTCSLQKRFHLSWYIFPECTFTGILLFFRFLFVFTERIILDFNYIFSHSFCLLQIPLRNLNAVNFLNFSFYYLCRSIALKDFKQQDALFVVFSKTKTFWCSGFVRRYNGYALIETMKP